MLKILKKKKSLYMHLYNIYYCSKLDFNLLLLEILKKKIFKFSSK